MRYRQGPDKHVSTPSGTCHLPCKAEFLLNCAASMNNHCLLSSYFSLFCLQQWDSLSRLSLQNQNSQKMGNARYAGHHLFVAILTSIATWVVPVGMFDSQKCSIRVDGQTKTRKVVDPHSFRIVTNEAGSAVSSRTIFTTGDERPWLMNFPFEGLTSGSKYPALPSASLCLCW